MENKTIKTNKFIRKLSLLVLILCLIGMFIPLLNNKIKVTGAIEDTYMKFPDFDPTRPEGTKENPFIILEIVPHRSMGQIGYVVGGQEPVDLSLIQDNNKWGEVIGVAQDSFVIDRDGPYDYRNVEMFRKDILHVDEDYNVRVVTITPDKLNENVEKFSKYYDLSSGGINNKIITGSNADDEIDLIAHCDLISISPMVHAGNPLQDLWKAYGRDTSGASYDKNSFKDSGNDISWQTSMELFMKVGMVKDKAALVFDYRIMSTRDVSETIGDAKAINLANETGMGYSSNLYKLCLMLKQYNSDVFFDMYLNPNNVTGGARIIEGYDNGRQTGKILLLDEDNNPKPESQQWTTAYRIYWGEHTFLPKNPFGPPLSNVGESIDYQQYLNDNDIIFSHIAGTGAYHDAVVRNIYHYNGGSSIVQKFNDYSRDDLCVKDDRDGQKYDFNDDFFTWLEEEKYDGHRPLKATPLEAIEFVLNYSRMNTKDIHILELQPCNDFTLTPELIKAKIPGLLGTITIDKQTTSEFIGKLDDLNSNYDMIYIGANTGMMKTDSYGNTIYNDPALDGLIYLHVGDRMVAYDALNGAMKDSSGNIIKARDQINGSYADIMKGLPGSGLNIAVDSLDFYRFSGNDINSLKYQELIEFASSGYPLIFDERLLDSLDDSLIDINLIDDSSYIYQFLQDGINNNSNIIPTSRIAENKGWIKEILKEDKLSVTMIDKPLDYTGDPSSRIAGRELTFKFNINKPDKVDSSTRYNWELYVDNNADGKYSPEERLKYGTNQAHSVDITVSQSLLKDDFADVIPWLIKVRQSDNYLIRTEISGMAAFRQEDDSLRTDLHVLQITSDNSTINLEKLMQPQWGKTTLFYEYTKDLKDFTLNIKTITVSDFLKMYNPNAPYYGSEFDPFNPKGTSKFVITVDGKIKYYDMLIFGFGDCYTDINNTHHALDDITHYIQLGKSVMFTHDTTSFVNMKESSYNTVRYGLDFWGYGINQYFRNTLGLDRFGVMRKDGDLTPYDKASMPSTHKDIYGGARYYPELQGLSYPVLMSYSNPGYGGSNNNPLSDKIHNVNRDYPVFNEGNEFSLGGNISNYHTKRVSKVNEGQITSYPYMIPDEFTIGNTHAQYYQLNMDDDEITVWYCLDDDVVDGKGAYSVSPNDVRNNYYIYNKKNIMYTGVGHEAIDSEYNIGSASSYGEHEVKLFINCMIASYQAGIQGPEIEITNEEARINSSGEYMLMAGTDQFESTDIYAPTKSIHFKPKDPNLTKSTLIVKIYRYNQLGEAQIIKPEVYIRGAVNRVVVPYEGDGINVEADREYSFDLALGANSNYYKGKASIYIEIINKEENLQGGAAANIIPIKLFDLD